MADWIRTHVITTSYLGAVGLVLIFVRAFT